MSIIQRIPWRVQPQFAAPLRTDLQLGFVLLPPAGGTKGRDLVTGAALTAAGASGTLAPSAGGMSLDYGSVSTKYAEYAIVPSFNTGSGDFCVGVSGVFHASTAISVALSNYVGLSSGGQWRLQPNANGSSTSSGSFCLITYDGSVFTNAGANSLIVAGEHATFLGVRRGTTHELWKNGQLVATTTGTVRNIGANASVGFGWNTSAYTAGGSRTLGFGILGTVSQSAANHLSANPWQIFAPLQRRIWVPSAGGGPTYTLSALTTSFALSGTATSLAFNRALTAVSGSFALSGTAAALKFNRSLTAGSGSFLLSGTNTSLKFNRVLSASSGVFLLTGTDSTLIYSGAGGPTYTLDVTNGNFALTGTNVTFNRNRVIQLGNGSFTLNGTNATLTYSGAPPPAGAILYLDLLSGKVLLLKQL